MFRSFWKDWEAPGPETRSSWEISWWAAVWGKEDPSLPVSLYLSFTHSPHTGTHARKHMHACAHACLHGHAHTRVHARTHTHTRTRFLSHFLGTSVPSHIKADCSCFENKAETELFPLIPLSWWLLKCLSEVTVVFSLGQWTVPFYGTDLYSIYSSVQGPELILALCVPWPSHWLQMIPLPGSCSRLTFPRAFQDGSFPAALVAICKWVADPVPSFLGDWSNQFHLVPFGVRLIWASVSNCLRKL